MEARHSSDTLITKSTNLKNFTQHKNANFIITSLRTSQADKCLTRDINTKLRVYEDSNLLECYTYRLINTD